MQNLKVPSFFHTITTALHQGDWEGHIAPPSSISWMCCRTSSTSCGAILLNLSLKGSSCSGSSSMTCLVASVPPISFLSRLKMWWNSIRSRLALRAVSFFQPSNFPRLPFSSTTFIKSSWHCSVVNGVSGSPSLASFTSNSSEATTSGTIFAATMWPTSRLAARCIGFPVLLCSTLDTFRLPSFSSV